jgi:hypothetical protein
MESGNRTAEQLKKFVFRFCEWGSHKGYNPKPFSHPPALTDRWKQFLEETTALEEYLKHYEQKPVYFIEHKETHLWWYEEEDYTKPNYIPTFNGGRVRGIGFKTKDCWTNNPNDERISYPDRESAQKMIDYRVGVYPDSVEITEHLFIDNSASQQCEALQSENERLKDSHACCSTALKFERESNTRLLERIERLKGFSEFAGKEVNRLLERVKELETWMANYRDDLKKVNVFHKNQAIINSIESALNPKE